MNYLRTEFRRIIVKPEVKAEIKKLRFHERVCLEEFMEILNDFDKDLPIDTPESVEGSELCQKKKLLNLLKSYGGRDVLANRLKPYGINLDTIMTASGIF